MNMLKFHSRAWLVSLAVSHNLFNLFCVYFIIFFQGVECLFIVLEFSDALTCKRSILNMSFKSIMSELSACRHCNKQHLIFLRHSDNFIVPNKRRDSELLFVFIWSLCVCYSVWVHIIVRDAGRGATCGAAGD